MTTLQAIIPDDIDEAVNSQRSTLNSQPAQRAAVALPPLGLTVEERAARGNWVDFERIMPRVPDAPPVPGDERMETAVLREEPPKPLMKSSTSASASSASTGCRPERSPEIIELLPCPIHREGRIHGTAFTL